MSNSRLKALIEGIIQHVEDGNWDVDGAAEQIMELLEETDSGFIALRSAMYAVNHDFAQQTLQAYERAVGK